MLPYLCSRRDDCLKQPTESPAWRDEVFFFAFSGPKKKIYRMKNLTTGEDEGGLVLVAQRMLDLVRDHEEHARN